MVTVTSRFRVGNGLEAEVRKAFLERPRLVESTDGFCGIEVLTDAKDAAVFYLVTRWDSEDQFRSWYTSDAYHQSHSMMPKGLKLDTAFTQVVVGTRIEDAAGFTHFGDALEGRTAQLAGWLMASDAVFAFILDADGRIRLRNSAGERIFRSNAEEKFGGSIWDYLLCSDADYFRAKLSKSGGRESCFPLNLDDGHGSQISAEVSLIECTGGFVLLGVFEQRYTRRLQEEMQELTDRLAVTARELSQKNKQLQTISQTDALTGLANRRAFFEALEREMIRANRLGKVLTLIIADIDHFKAINDQFGHVVGDVVLARTGQVFAEDSRPYDLNARYGGEEFVRLLPEIAVPEAVIVAERMRKNIAAAGFTDYPHQVTVSLGVAAMRAADSAEEFVARADAALYLAKSGGRNRVDWIDPVLN
jgi:diguanylate cyclase (GGDEF)-like protein